MAITLVLVVVVIFLFLRNGRATMIPALALPFSIVGTLSVMALMGFSLNNLSMMALILSVVLRGGRRHRHAGEHRPAHRKRRWSRCEAALSGSKEIGFTIVSMTLSLAAVFIPMLFMGGILGRMFREFAVTICAAILISGVVSDHADAHAVQPIAAGQQVRSTARSTALPTRSSKACSGFTTGACAGFCATGR